MKRFLKYLTLCVLPSVFCSRQNQCPGHLTKNHYLKTFRDQCYLFVPNEKYWSDARDDCHNRGHGHHVVIPDKETQEFVMQSLVQLKWRKNGIWIGAYDFEGPWQWVTGQRITWSNWDHDQPGSRCVPFLGCEDCANLRLSDGKWHDYLCDSLRYKYTYICQFPMIKSNNSANTLTNNTIASEVTRPTKVISPEANPNQLMKNGIPFIIKDIGPIANRSALEASKETLSNTENLSAGAVVGIVVAVSLLFIIVIVIVVLILLNRRRKKNGEEPAFVFSNITYVIRTLKRSTKPKKQRLEPRNNSAHEQTAPGNANYNNAREETTLGDGNYYGDLPERRLKKPTNRNQTKESDFYKNTSSITESDITNIKSGFYDDIADYEEPRCSGVSNFGFESLEDEDDYMKPPFDDDDDFAKPYPYDYVDYCSENYANEKANKINLNCEENDLAKPISLSHKKNVFK